jgi:hypothetical protein
MPDCRTALIVSQPEGRNNANKNMVQVLKDKTIASSVTNLLRPDQATAFHCVEFPQSFVRHLTRLPP